MNQRLLIASGPVIIENGKVLLTKHGDDPFWKFCGSRTNGLEETLKQTAIRTAKAEVGIELEFADQEPFLMHVEKQTPAGIMDILLVHYLAKRIGEVHPGAHIIDWAWIDPSTVDPKDLAPNIMPTLRFFQGKTIVDHFAV